MDGNTAKKPEAHSCQEDRNGLTPLGKAIKIAAIKRGITLTKVAASIGTTNGFLWQMMKGKRPGTKYLNKISELLDIDLDDYAV